MVLVEEKQQNRNVAGIISQFLAQIENELDSEMAAASKNDAEVVIFEIHVDGVRYTLTGQRCVEKENSRIFLSPREREVIRLVMKGLPTRAIAGVLDISPWTVSTHVRRVFAKLNVGSRAEMVARALQEGVLQDLE